jgi:ATP-GRASP peptide maturase of grasp-with-spasm system
MILIVSESDDGNTDKVIDWLLSMKINCIRINTVDFIDNIELELHNDKKNKLILWVRNKKINIDELTGFYFRKGFIAAPRFESELKHNSELHTSINEHLLSEWSTLEEFVVRELYKMNNTLGSYTNGDINKLYALECAKKVGLSIPNTIVTTRRKSLENFHSEYKDIITKNIQDVLCFRINDSSHKQLTNTTNKKDIAEMSTRFMPSLLQKNIEKKYELRIFYLKKKFFSMAIFSQVDDLTKTDYRNYNNDYPNRTVPYQLPNELQDKLIRLMEILEIDTGSIDMIVTKSNEFVFLEVNPCGQYDMISVPCNYYLDKEIALELI